MLISWCHQSSDTALWVCQPLVLATVSFHAGSTWTCVLELPNHLYDFALHGLNMYCAIFTFYKNILLCIMPCCIHTLASLASFPGRFFSKWTEGRKRGLVLIVSGRGYHYRKLHHKTCRKTDWLGIANIVTSRRGCVWLYIEQRHYRWTLKGYNSILIIHLVKKTTNGFQLPCLQSVQYWGHTK